MSPLSKTIAVLPGDGIGPEVIGAATQFLRDAGAEFGHRFEFAEYPIGGNAIDAFGTPLPAETLDACRAADAVLLGAVGGPRWDALPIGKRPESGLLEIRKGLELYVNLRPVKMREPLRNISPLRPERTAKIDMEIVRELAGGIYFGARRVEDSNGTTRAEDTESYSTPEIERVARFAFARAESREKQLASVDKANILASSALWRKTVTQLAGEYPAVRLNHLYVDNAAMQLVLAPQQFDVILASNMFGDILSDAAAGLLGSIGLVPSMSCGSGPAFYEPIHGSAPQLAGQDRANPIGSILCISMMLRDSFGLEIEADWIETAVDRVLARGYRTPDIADADSEVVGCSRLAAMIRAEMQGSVEQLERYGWGV